MALVELPSGNVVEICPLSWEEMNECIRMEDASRAIERPSWWSIVRRFLLRIFGRLRALEDRQRGLALWVVRHGLLHAADEEVVLRSNRDVVYLHARILRESTLSEEDLGNLCASGFGAPTRTQGSTVSTAGMTGANARAASCAKNADMPTSTTSSAT